MSAVVASDQPVTNPLASYVTFVFVAQVIAAFDSTKSESDLVEAFILVVPSHRIILSAVKVPLAITSQLPVPSVPLAAFNVQ